MGYIEDLLSKINFSRTIVINYISQRKVHNLKLVDIIVEINNFYKDQFYLLLISRNLFDLIHIRQFLLRYSFIFQCLTWV